MQTQLLDIICNPNLSPKQKTLNLASTAESMVDYQPLSDELVKAKELSIICDMFEGNAPFKPRYVLPDYALFLQQGSVYLELSPAEDFDDALNHLTILYHHVPSVTNIPVFLGHLDKLLLPFVNELTEQEIYKKLKRFWIMLDRVLPDAFMHVNIGPVDNIICRTILKIDGELKQVAPNLTLLYKTEVTPDSLLKQACENICHTGKPHIANHVIHQQTFEQLQIPDYGIVSCYNSLPIAGGCNNLVRLNLKKVAEESDSIAQFFEKYLPYYSSMMIELIDVRSQFLHEKSNFFESFLTKENLISENKFAPMFGIFGMAETVAILLNKDMQKGLYGSDDNANQLGFKISQWLANFVQNSAVKYGLNNRSLLHSQGGISCDIDVTPGIRIQYGKEPDPVNHLLALAPQHQFYHSGVSEILTLDETIKNNPDAMMQLCKGAFNAGLREFTANVGGNDLMRITGYMIKQSDIEKYQDEGSRTNTTWLGEEALKTTQVSQRKQTSLPSTSRVVANEFNLTHR